MSNRSGYSSRRKRKATFYLVCLLLLIALVFGVWLLVLDKDSPYNRRHAKNDASTAPTPVTTVAATEVPAETPAETAAVTPVSAVTPIPAAATTATQDPLPTPTPEAGNAAAPTPTATALPIPVVTAKPAAEPTAIPAAVVTAIPTAEPTAEPVATAEPAPTPTPEPTATPQPTPRYYYPLPSKRGAAADGLHNGEPTPSPESADGASGAETGVKAKVTLSTAEGRLNLRSTASTTAGVLASLPNGTMVDVLGYEGNWAHVRVNGQEGYVSKDYLKEVETAAPTESIPADTPAPENTPEQPASTPAPENTPEPQKSVKAKVTLSTAEGKLNLRSTASTTGGVLASLPNGTMVDVLGYEGNWAHVTVNGQEGYVSKDYLKEVETAPNGNAATGENASATANNAAPVSLDLPYMIEVDRGMQVVRVFTIGEDGEYSLLAREMICSTDSFDRKPPNGTYALNGERQRWLTTFTPDSYAQYATRITGHILFHSVPYSALRPDALNTEAYAALGTNVSIGCVRLLCADAKWIYDNVPAGTVVKYVTGERDEAKLAALKPPALVGGKWDPTDSNPENPDYSADYENAHPVATPVPGVTPAPTAPWTPDTYT